MFALSLSLWHRRLGHPNLRTLKSILNSFSLPYSHSTEFHYYHSCLCTKSIRLPFTTISLKSHTPLELIYTNVWGPSPLESIDKHRYYVIFVDQFSKYTWLYPIKNKSDVLQAFSTFKSTVENFFQTTIKSVYSDDGGEFLTVKQFLNYHGIQHFLSPPYIPQRVAQAERKHHYIIETAQTLLHQASLPYNL